MQDDLINIKDLDDMYEDDSEQEALEVAFRYNIDSYTNAIPVERLIEDFNKSIIVIPDFQRPYVWNRADRKTGRHRPSLFIDSILLGLPIPPISIYKDHDAREKGFLIDGRQRLVTLSAFKKGAFEDGKPFILKGENISKDWLGKGYETLPEELQERFNRAYIPVMYIRQLTKDLEQTPGASSIYLLFDRLNSGGYALTPHEKRGVLGIHNSGILQLIKSIYQFDAWKDIFPETLLDYVNRPYNQSQVEEIIFRAIAFSLSYENYNGNIARFLDTFMLSYDVTNQEDKIMNVAKLTVNAIANNNNIQNYFKPQGKFSISLFESIFVGLYRAGGKVQQFEEKYMEFVQDGSYLPQGKRSLSTKGDVINKFKKVIEIFHA